MIEFEELLYLGVWYYGFGDIVEELDVVFEEGEVFGGVELCVVGVVVFFEF